MGLSTPYPLVLAPTLSRRLWGGWWLSEFLELAPEHEAEPIGEAWVAYGGNRIVNGPLADSLLSEATALWGQELIGSVAHGQYGNTVPLLAKFIDARDKLSIQVHPDDAFARHHEGSTGHLGKAEAWLIVSADEGAGVLWGLEQALTQEQVRELADEGGLEQHLNVINVRRGDVIYNPPGTIHAILGGVFLFEIQQASDLTYRLYDYGRNDAAGNPRELHLDKALAVADLTPGVRGPISPIDRGDGVIELVRCEHFVLERIEVTGRRELATSFGSLDIVVPLDQELTVENAGERNRVPRGRAVVVPACLGPYELAGTSTVLRSYVPGRA